MLKLPELNEKGITLQTVVLTAVTTLAAVLLTWALWRVFTRQAEDAPGRSAFAPVAASTYIQ